MDWENTTASRYGAKELTIADLEKAVSLLKKCGNPTFELRVTTAYHENGALMKAMRKECQQEVNSTAGMPDCSFMGIPIIKDDDLFPWECKLISGDDTFVLIGNSFFHERQLYKAWING